MVELWSGREKEDVSCVHQMGQNNEAQAHTVTKCVGSDSLRLFERDLFAKE